MPFTMKSSMMKNHTTNRLTIKALPLFILFALPGIGGATSLNQATNKLPDKKSHYLIDRATNWASLMLAKVLDCRFFRLYLAMLIKSIR